MVSKKWLMVVAAIALVVLLAACGSGQTAQAQPPQEEQSSQQPLQEEPESLPQEEPEPLPQEQPQPTPQEPARQENFPQVEIGEEARIKAAEAGLAGNYEEFRGYLQQMLSAWEGECWAGIDQNSFSIYFVLPGLTQTCMDWKAQGYDQTQPDWAEMRDSICQLCTLMQQDAQMFDLPEMTGHIKFLNEANYDNVLLFISDGAVLYDVMSDGRE